MIGKKGRREGEREGGRERQKRGKQAKGTGAICVQPPNKAMIDC